MFQNAWRQIKSIQVIHIDHGEPRWSIRIIRIHLKPPAPGPCRLKQSGIPYSMTPWDMTQYAAGCRRSGNIREFLSRLPWDHILSMWQVLNIPQVHCTETIGWLYSAYCPKKRVAPVSVSCGSQSRIRWLSRRVILNNGSCYYKIPVDMVHIYWDFNIHWWLTFLKDSESLRESFRFFLLDS